MELWMPTKELPDKYHVSNLGNIKRVPYLKEAPNGGKGMSKEKVLKQWVRGGYRTVELCSRTYFVHRLVCAAFNENPLNKEYVNHKDGNKLNNVPDNLEWCTKSENALHMYKTGLKIAPTNEESMCCKYSNEIISEVRHLLKTNMKQRDIAKECGVSQSLVSCINRGLLRPLK